MLEKHGRADTSFFYIRGLQHGVSVMKFWWYAEKKSKNKLDVSAGRDLLKPGVNCNGRTWWRIKGRFCTMCSFTLQAESPSD